MTHALIRDGAPVELLPGLPFVDADGIQRPGNWLDLSSEIERTEAGVRTIVEPPLAPEGTVHIAGPLAIKDDAVVRAYRVEPVPAPAVPVLVSETQFMRAAVRLQFVTGDEAEAYLARGEIPAFVDLALDGLPDDDRIDGRLKVVGADTFLRADPMFAYLIDKKVATSDQVDDLFRLAATLI